MTNEQIKAGNRAIAIFMNPDLLVLPTKDGVGEKRGAPIQYENWYNISRDKDLKYHSSWDWLMPVVEKIEAVKGVYFDIYREATIVKYQPEDFKVWGVTEYDQENKIDHVYRAALRFITWYNSQSNISEK